MNKEVSLLSKQVRLRVTVITEVTEKAAKEEYGFGEINVFAVFFLSVFATDEQVRVDLCSWNSVVPTSSPNTSEGNQECIAPMCLPWTNTSISKRESDAEQL